MTPRPSAAESVLPVPGPTSGASAVREPRPQGRLERTGQRDSESGLPAVDWRPIDAPLRIIGPGRREVALRSQVSELEQSLEVARLVERGTARYVDRMEDHLGESRAQVARLAAGLGSLATENQALREALTRTERRLARVAAPQPSRWTRLLASVTGRRT